MALYLGTLGRMVEIRGAASLDEDPADLYTFRTSLERLVRPQFSAYGARSWNVALPPAMTPLEVAKIAAFARGGWGRGPFFFLSPDAQVQNILSPQTSMCMPGTVIPIADLTMVEQGGPMLTSDGWAEQSWVKSTENSLFFEVPRSPVLPGEEVTASVYVQGAGAAAGISFYNASNTFIRTHVATAKRVDRSHVTVTVPAGAASARVYVNAATTRCTWPALTWTGELYEYGEGRGCAQAVISSYSRSLRMAIKNPKYGRYSQPSFTLQEVG